MPSKKTVDRLAQVFPRVMHGFHNLSSAVSRVHELTLAQHRLLRVLQDRGPCTVNEIAAALEIAQSSASELVSRMVNSDLLCRVPRASDRRVAEIALSDRARTILQQGEKAMHGALQDLLAGMPAREQETFVRAFEKIDTLLRTRTEKDPAHA